MKYLLQSTFLALCILNLASCGDSSQVDLNEQEQTFVNHLVLGGEDTRERITSPVGIEEHVGVVLIQFENSASFECTGTLISKYHILTSAHCLHNENGDFAKSVAFRPQLLDPYNRTAHFEAETFWISAEYKKQLQQRRSGTTRFGRHDLAIIYVAPKRFRRSPGRRFGWAEFSYHEDSKLNETPSLQAYLVGYPLDKELYTLWRSECEISVDGPNLYRTPCDLNSGQSGSPLVLKDEQDGQEKVYGVVSFSNFLYQMNYSTRITKKVYEDFTHIIENSNSLGQFIRFDL